MDVNRLVKSIVDEGIDSLGRHYSIYRGLVVNIEDELNIDRLLVYIPELNVQEWALPRNSHGSHLCGFRQHPLPKVNDVVYITFEDANPSLPLWEWHGWAENQKPLEFDDPDVCGVITPKGTKVLVNDRTGEIIIDAKTRMVIKSNGDDGLVIAGNRVYINSKDKIIFNQGTKDGVVNINELTDKLNNLIQELEVLKENFNSHTHTGVTTGSSVSGVTLQQQPSFTRFNKEEYEDKNFLH